MSKPLSPIPGSRYGRTVAERFWEKVNKNGPLPKARPELGPCWIWTGSVSGGYGRFRVAVHSIMPPHRFVLVLAGIEIPAGYDVDHLCRQKLCVNPEHLEPVTPAENKHRVASDACDKGHTKEPGQRCFLCSADYQDEYARRHAGRKRERSRIWHEANRDRANARRREHYARTGR